MSHISTVEVIIQDLQALRTACESLGLEFVADQKVYKWYGRAFGRAADPQDGRCDHAIRVKGNQQAYEIGVVKKQDGSGYELRLDDFQNGYGLMDLVGKGAMKLRQGYATEVAVRAAKRAGFRVTKRELRSDGSIALTTTR